MKYVAFRIDRAVLPYDGKAVPAFVVRGQRNTDLNWPSIGGVNTIDEAKSFIKNSLITNPAQQPVYDTHGNAITL